MSKSTPCRACIGISAIPRDVATGYGPDRADTVARGMVAGVVRAGGVPLVLPVVDEDLAVEQAQVLDGLLLSGGQDLDAELRGEERHPASTWLDPARDRHEAALLRAALDRGIPILGICRGLQLVAHELGGTLLGHVDGHDSSRADPGAGHDVALADGSRLARALGAGSARVNSIHHQVVERLPSGLACVAQAADGTVEAAEGSVGRSRFLGVQWHPELMLDYRGGQDVFDVYLAQVDGVGEPGRSAR
jgi:putative glutamine amidotransferase